MGIEPTIVNQRVVLPPPLEDQNVRCATSSTSTTICHASRLAPQKIASISIPPVSLAPTSPLSEQTGRRQVG